MDFEECIKKRIVKNIEVDHDLIISLKKASERKLSSAKKLGIDNTTTESVISLAYDSLRVLLESIAINHGYKIYNHDCYHSFIIKILKLEKLADSFNRIRKLINTINYYGEEVSVSDAKDIFNEITDLIKQFKQIHF